MQLQPKRLLILKDGNRKLWLRSSILKRKLGAIGDLETCPESKVQEAHFKKDIYGRVVVVDDVRQNLCVEAPSTLPDVVPPVNTLPQLSEAPALKDNEHDMNTTISINHSNIKASINKYSINLRKRYALKPKLSYHSNYFN